ncbi:hypothetical protein JXA56_02420 [Candidatus Micrarchaeota archaeon]|nr:hypothetical protein [Candidatus Micrarchaeota archaeon]
MSDILELSKLLVAEKKEDKLSSKKIYNIDVVAPLQTELNIIILRRDK